MNNKPLKSIAIINDNEMTLRTARTNLSVDPHINWKVYLINTEQELSDLLESERPIDVAIVDIHLQPYDTERLEWDYTKFQSPGTLIAEMLRSRGLPVAITSGAVGSRERRRADAIGIPIFDTGDLLSDGELHPFRFVANAVLQESDGSIRREQEL